MEILKKKTFWIGIATILAGLIESNFAGDEGTSFSLDFGATLANLKIWVGLGFITGRQAVLKGTGK